MQPPINPINPVKSEMIHIERLTGSQSQLIYNGLATQNDFERYTEAGCEALPFVTPAGARGVLRMLADDIFQIERTVPNAHFEQELERRHKARRQKAQAVLYLSRSLAMQKEDGLKSHREWSRNVAQLLVTLAVNPYRFTGIPYTVEEKYRVRAVALEEELVALFERARFEFTEQNKVADSIALMQLYDDDQQFIDVDVDVGYAINEAIARELSRLMGIY